MIRWATGALTLDVLVTYQDSDGVRVEDGVLAGAGETLILPVVATCAHGPDRVATGVWCHEGDLPVGFLSCTGKVVEVNPGVVSGTVRNGAHCHCRLPQPPPLCLVVQISRTRGDLLVAALSLENTQTVLLFEF